jgi:hypothetical protein
LKILSNRPYNTKHSSVVNNCIVPERHLSSHSSALPSLGARYGLIGASIYLQKQSTFQSFRADDSYRRHCAFFYLLLAVDSIMRFSREISLALLTVQNAHAGWTAAVRVSQAERDATASSY